MGRLSRPLNRDAVKAADDEFYAKHPEFVKDGKRIPLSDTDPSQADLRKEWVVLYKKHGGKEEGDKNKPPVKKPDDPVQPCPLATQDPGITTVSGPKDLGCGGFDWKVWFDIPNAAGKDGWIIQEVTASFDAVNPDGSSNFKKTYHYWEAWEVKSGKKVTVWQDQAKDDNDDQYFSPSRPGTKGTIKFVGKAKFIEGPLPADFKTNNPDTIAGILHSTTQKPDCWDGSGTDHNIESTWDCTGAAKSSKVTGKAGDQEVNSTK